MKHIEAGAAAIIGMIAGMLILAISLFSGEAKVISLDFVCTKTAIIGVSPNREESCVRYERGSEQ